MIKKLISLFSFLSLSQTKGRFLSDKSYAYDTVFFISRYIYETSDNALIFNTKEEEERVVKYTKDIFQLRDLGTGAKNYLRETLNILQFGNVIDKIDNYKYKIINNEILEFISNSIENSYIYLYLLVYKTFQNDGLISYYNDFLNYKDKENKELVLKKILDVFKEKTTFLGTRTQNDDTNWSKQLVKYAIIVLGYANNGTYVPRTLIYRNKDKIRDVNIEDVSINVEGRRTGQSSKKINDYIKTFNKDYVQFQLENYLINKVNYDKNKINSFNHIAEDLASLKIEKLLNETDKLKYHSKYEQDRFVQQKTKIRNKNIQKAFKDSLLAHNKHKCPICDFEYEDFLIAAHIKPYSICDDTYDAINDNNGFLLCPNHDKLFESVNNEILMTIEADTGKIILSDKVKNSKDFGYLDGKYIDKSLVQCERRHYLKWHNDAFKKSNKIK